MGIAFTADQIVRLDEIISTISGIGGERDKGAATNLGLSGTKVIIPELALALYRTHYGGKIVDSYVRDSFRRGWRWSSQRKHTKLTKAFKDCHAEARLKAADTWSQVYGSHYLLLELDDDSSWDQPVDFTAVRGIKRIITAGVTEVTPEQYIPFEHALLANPALQYGDPLTYTVQLQSPNDLNPMFVAHTDRVLRFDGIALERQDRMQSSNGYPGSGDSIYVRLYDDIVRQGLVEGAMATLISEFNIGMMVIKGLRGMLASDQTDEMVNRLIAMNMGKSIANMIPVDEGESFERRSITVAGLPDIYDRLAQSLASAAEQSMTEFFGQTPGGLSTDDKSGRISRDNVIYARQNDKLRPAIEYLAMLITKNRSVPELIFNPLTTPDEVDAAGIRKTQAETDKINVELGIVSKKEVRESRFGGWSYSTETTLLDETPDAEVELADADALSGPGAGKGADAEGSSEDGGTPV